MDVLNGAAFLALIVKAIKLVVKGCYWLGILPFLIVIVLVMTAPTESFLYRYTAIWCLLATILFVLHWINYFFIRFSNTGESHILVYLFKKITRK